MARFGTWSPLAANWAAQQRMTQVDILSIHTIVGTLAGTDGMWRKTGYTGNHSHFGLGGHGEITQWQDTLYRAAANYTGNWHIISVECADMGDPFPAWNINDGSAVPAFTPAQCESLAQLIAAMCKAHNIPCQLIPDSKPGRRGIGWHRLGVPGYVVAGGELWSTVNRKACPGDRRIAQIPAIVARAQQILAPTPAPAPEDDLNDAQNAALTELWNALPAIREMHDRVMGVLPGKNNGRDAQRVLDTGDGGFIVQAVNNSAASLTATLSSVQPAQIAAAIPAGLAKQVADELAKRLGS